MSCNVFKELLNKVTYCPITGHLTWLPEYTPFKGRERGYAGTVDGRGYIIVRLRGKGFKAHRLAWALVRGFPLPAMIDHKDGNPSNNTWGNLRASDSEHNPKKHAADS